MTQPSAADNLLLGTLPADLRDEVVRHAELVKIDLRQRLYESEEPLAYVYFPLNGLVSIVAISREGSTVEVGPVGCDGMVGLPVFLGGRTDPLEAFVQVGPVNALRLRSRTFTDLVAQLPAFDRLLRLYTQWTYYGMAQWVLCARLHPLEERLGRWLLMCHDRLGCARFELTHEFLAEMLGVRRASVTVAAGTLRSAGLIEYQRGEVIILDRPRLEDASCECNRVTAAEYERLFGRPPRDPRSGAADARLARV